jgi:hypothetical protein
MGELEDMVRKLNQLPSTVALCAQAFSAYEKQPSEENKDKLRLAYDQVPKHLRCYCGDMDTKDHAIKRALSMSEE